MAFEHPGAGALDYFPCRYGKSKVLYRGPRRRLDGAYAAVLGGSATYGKFVAAPFPALLEETLGVTVVNFGCMNAGVDVLVNDSSITDICTDARVTVVQLVGAQNMSNRFYAVHPRRNDRFLRASPLMKSLFAEVDFTDFHFTRHMLQHLRLIAPTKFGMIEAELKQAWVARMCQFLMRLQGRSVLLRLNESPGHGVEADRTVQDHLGPEPLLVDKEMEAEVTRHAGAIVHVTPSAKALAAGTDGMIFGEFDRAAAETMPGPAVHTEIAEALLPVMRRLM